MARKLVLPRVHVMVLCDEIDVSPEEENVFNLLGVRTRILAGGFPCTHPQLCVYLQLTGHAGTTACHVEVMDAETDEVVIATQPEDVELLGPLTVLPVVFRLTDCEFATSGLYYVQVICDHKLVCERPLVVQEE